MSWEAPDFIEVKMDAEINSYQDDCDREQADRCSRRSSRALGAVCPPVGPCASGGLWCLWGSIVRIRVLGTAAGGGFPQWNCGCPNCRGVRAGLIMATPRTQECVAVS